MNKKNLLIFACACLAAISFLVSRPFRANAAEIQDKTFHILASTFPVYLFTANICDGAKNVTIDLLVPAAAGCPHDFAPGPADIQKLSRASVLVINGAGLEDFLAAPLKNIGSGIPVIEAAQDMKLLRDSVHGHANPHVFAAPRDAAAMVSAIASGLSYENSENAAIYEKNAKNYREKLLNLSADFAKIGKKAVNKGIALEHDALAYLAMNAGLDILTIFENASSASALRKLEKELKAGKPALLAGDEQYSDRLLDTLSKETGIPFAMLNPCASGPTDAPLDYYETVMKKNLQILGAHFE